MNKTTKYQIVSTMTDADIVAKLLDEGYAIIASWVTKDTVHHILEAPAKQGKE